MTKKRIQPHIMCGVGDVAKYVLLPGDPRRVEKIASFFDEAHKVAEYRGFVTCSGKVDGIDISACSTGIGCPSAAIVVEELMKIGAETFIRVGTTGALQSYIEIGDIVIATAAVRTDGTSRAYLPVEYPAVASYEVVSALLQASKRAKKKTHSGIVMSSDAFYSENTDATWQFSKANVLSIEMECSTIFTLTGLKGLRSGAIMAVDGNLVKGIKKGEFEPGEKTGELDERVQKAVEDEIRITIEAVKILEGTHSST
ncbi:MAG: nucleoside phosphorylase [Candidatus Bathyarchaeota archaeon]|nr:MAG: nucleoside phosphorylase [Candidatus Bathyarchaeota archaeon]UCE57338.1 MAG: nucleoside phosphorylase [Candidatus Bathyarchaeota archaeon]